MTNVTRRTALTAAGAVSLGVVGITSIVSTAFGASSGDAFLETARAGACTLTPEVTEGPYYLPLEIVRKNITEGRPGLPLTLRVKVIDYATCKVIQGAVLDIWHCSALGVYSGYDATTPPGGPGGGGPSGGPGLGPGPGMPPSGFPGGPPGGPSGGPEGGAGGHATPTNSETFLRGVQMTDHTGRAEFTTIFPGWYQGRTVHLHAKVHVGSYLTGGTAKSGHVSHTGQFFFPERLTSRVATLKPYRTNTTERTTNDIDMQFNAGGSAGLLKVVQQHKDFSKGLIASVTVAVDPEATPATI
ncbi:intradiol ring-cleavage dioxygenase [Winogradskya consettensis]|uniref:Protocatechuate dioxygenase n=1 Tax=Winogradskya consettensis TaxID=113560 RepID=A0A919T1E2_9ACTN|nr:intradiol ring-cleavage dioxygenase [Actinoplanes consettensis]GIM80883.1 protocatechuate dioxygenase [Actinoplanes consettensis]